MIWVQLTVVGVAIGAIYALAGMGLVLTYKATGIFNFAYGGIAMLVAYMYWQMRSQWHWPLVIAAPIALLVVGPGIGVLLERVVFRPLERRGASTPEKLVATLGVFLLWRGKLYTSKPMLWALMVAFPFTFIANIAGWATTETGRQPWVVYGLLRTANGASPAGSVPAGTGIFTLLGFAGLYLLVGVLFILLIVRIVSRGPEDPELTTTSTQATAGTM